MATTTRPTTLGHADDTQDLGHHNKNLDAVGRLPKIKFTDSCNKRRKFFQFFRKKKPKSKRLANDPCPMDTTNLFCKMWFSWMTPVFSKAWKGTLGKEDLYTCSQYDSAELNTERLEHLWRNELDRRGPQKASLARVYCKFLAKQSLISCLLSFISMAMSFISSAFIVRLLLEYSDQETSDLTYGLSLAAGMVFCQANFIIFMTYSWYINIRIGGRTRAATVCMIYHKIVRLRSMKGLSIGEIVNLCTNDGQRFFDMLLYLPHALAGPLLAVLALIYTVLLIGPAAILGTGVFILFYPLQGIFSKVIAHYRQRTIKVTDHRVRLMSEIINSIKLIKMYAWEESFAATIGDIREKERRLLLIGGFFQAICQSVTTFVPMMSTILTLSLHTLLGNDVTAAQAFSYVAVLNSIRFMITATPNAIKSVTEAFVSFPRIKSLLLMAELVEFTTKPSDPSLALVLNDVKFAWDKDKPTDFETPTAEPAVTTAINRQKIQGLVGCGEEAFSTETLFDINLSIRKSELLGICGTIGSGKSSLLQAFLGRMILAGGHVAVDGSFAYVSQQPCIMNMTLQENILLGAVFERERYETALNVCALQDDLDMLPDGDNTEIGERGINISGGQKQRVSLARALYSNRDIYLLDDPLSAVDAHVGRHIFSKCISSALKSKTVLLVTHQLQYLNQCDRIILMKDGRIVEDGTHKELMASGQEYCNLIQTFHNDDTDDEDSSRRETVSRLDVESSNGADGRVPSENDRDNPPKIFHDNDTGSTRQDDAHSTCPQVEKDISLTENSTCVDDSEPRPSDYLNQRAQDNEGITFRFEDENSKRQDNDDHKRQDDDEDEDIDGSSVKENLTCIIDNNQGCSYYANRSNQNKEKDVELTTNNDGILKVNEEVDCSDEEKPCTTLPVWRRQQMDGTENKDGIILEMMEDPTSCDDDDDEQPNEKDSLCCTASKEMTVVKGHYLGLHFEPLRSADTLSTGIVSVHSEDAIFYTGKLTEDEDMGERGVTMATAGKYIQSAGGILPALSLFLLFAVSVSLAGFSNWWLSIWLNQGSGNSTVVVNNVTLISGSIADNPRLQFYQFVYGMLAVGIVITTACRCFAYTSITLRASSNLHKLVFHRVVHGTMSFFDTTPLGRILNRFSKDLDELDISLPYAMHNLINNAFLIIFSLVTTVIIFPWLFLPLFLIFVVFLGLNFFFHHGIREIKKFDNVTRSVWFAHIMTTVHSLAMVHAYGKQIEFIKRFHVQMDDSTNMLTLFYMANRWLAIRFDVITVILTTSTALMVVLTHGIVPAATSGLALIFANQLLGILQFTVRMASEVDARFTSAERVCDYIQNVDQEAPPTIKKTEPGPDWPSKGHIAIRNLRMRYRSNLPLVLRGINVDIKPQEKVGIVGRTGSGKSSLGVALYRLVEKSHGSIIIDGVDISQIGLRDLRSRLSIIPQDPVLFIGTIRYNLDPTSKFTDLEIWEALEKTYIKEMISNLDHQLNATVAENGENFSVGERQLLCMARALLRNSKILILDEATAAIDAETDSLVQQTIRHAFTQCTILTIAHRLNTILDSDRILVLNNGKVVEFDCPSKLLAKPTSIFSRMMAAAGSKLAQSDVGMTRHTAAD